MRLLSQADPPPLSSILPAFPRAGRPVLLAVFGFFAALSAGSPLRSAPPDAALPAWIDGAQAMHRPQSKRVFPVADFGAIGDGKTDATAAIQRAIDAASAAGGGTVQLSGGTYLSAALFVKSHVRLEIDAGATILGSHDEQAYPIIPTRIAGIEMDWPAALINVNDQTDVEISGAGTIDGQGELWWKKYWDLRKTYEPRGIRWAADYDCQRVRLLVVWKSSDVTIQGLHLRRAGFWTVQLAYSDRLTVDGVRITDNQGPSTDGVDVDSSSHVLVQHCDIDNNDDDICLKAGRDYDGLRVNRPTEFVVIRDNITRRGGGLITFGSETSGGIRHVVAYRDTAIGTSEGIRFKSARTRGGTIEDVLIRDIVMRDVPLPFTFTLNWNPSFSYATIPKEIRDVPDYWKVMTHPVEPPERGYADFRDITIAHVDVSGARRILSAEGLSVKPLGAVRWTDVHAQGREAGSVQFANDWSMDGVRFETLDGKPLKVSNSRDVGTPTVAVSAPDLLHWPEPAVTARPWTRWWWLGSAVDRPNIDRLMTDFHQAGLGGVEICPIYGAKGYEQRFISYLSPQWMEMLSATLEEGRKLGVGVDLTTGTGWPMGGPWIPAEHASAEAILRTFAIPGGGVLIDPLPNNVQCAVAVGSEGRRIDVTSHVRGARLDWTAPEGIWRLYVVAMREPIQQVKRSAPGDEGNVVDPFSVEAMNAFVARFDQAFQGYKGTAPRAEFHDSYEYFGATWTPDFFAEFSRRRGYDLRNELVAFFGEGDPERAARVKADYRQTIGELHEAYVARWNEWSHSHGSLSREQAHGAPANIEDVYAETDIPESEFFGGMSEEQIPMLEFASSAAHLTGHPLASCESFTWLGEHFQVALSDLKAPVDLAFLSGINHIFLHGIPYSPVDAPWPGWLFYASVNFGPEGGLWHDLPAFNAYATRCQSILQSGKPANDLLLYFPVFDFWQRPDGLVEPFTTPGKWMWGSAFHDVAMHLWSRGYSYDEVTDQLLASAKVEGGRVILGGNSYRAILLPRTRLLPVSTLRRLVEFAKSGATIAVEGSIPTAVPGLGRLEERKHDYQLLLASLNLEAVPGTDVLRAAVGSGAFYVGSDLDRLLRASGAPREAMVDDGLHCIRRLEPDGYAYFIANTGGQEVNRWVELATHAEAAVLMDPLEEDRTGRASLRNDASGRTWVYLQLSPGQSRILRTTRSAPGPRTPWNYRISQGEARPILGNWQVHFASGGPVLPHDFTTSALGSWANRDDVEARRFAGTAVYRVEFTAPPTPAEDWRLDLGRVCESARIRVNGHEAGTAWCAPFSLPVGRWLVPGVNILEVEVTNVAANRIADLDRRHVEWKQFYEINFVDRNYHPFDASAWPVRASGLLGPVTLIPLRNEPTATAGGTDLGPRGGGARFR